MFLSRLAVASVLVVAVAILGLTTVRNARAADDMMPGVGQPAPEFSLPSQEGKNVSLDGYRGKWVVLYFYPKDMTSGCTMEAHKFQEDLPKYQKDNAVILGVSVDSAESHKTFCAKEGLSFKLLSDEQKTTVAKYGSLGNYMGFKIAKRNTFLIDPQGRIARVWTAVDPANHSAQVLAALAELEKRNS
jgi:thioredoxin-dependent peroxiredoxin